MRHANQHYCIVVLYQNTHVTKGGTNKYLRQWQRLVWIGIISVRSCNKFVIILHLKQSNKATFHV